MMCGGQGSETGDGEGNPMERMRRHRRSHGGAASAGRPRRPELARRGGGAGRRAGAHPPGPTLSRDTSSSAGRGGRPRPHPRPSRACGSAPRPSPLSLHAQCADKRTAGSGRLRFVPAPALVAAAAAAPHSRPRLRHHRRLPRPFGPAPARFSNHTPRHCARHRRDGRTPAPWPKFGKGRTRTLPPVGARVPLGLRPRALPELFAPRYSEKTLGYTGARCLQSLHCPRPRK
ncbi:uncharacterized protein LOC127695860 [Apodemus sylvaticus]|uniref:uncharacterized protein LOC127695860 n=1 Tax=Apodemus sylvaticus TaxID=10129 RepID=UPI002242AB6E|nr:uncharacterized protein LOC127695860 [Apodemus sylvaticus]XP_052053989.1 uncharacterized protein LOC127695860 [Apodemus sylvaticus]